MGKKVDASAADEEEAVRKIAELVLENIDRMIDVAKGSAAAALLPDLESARQEALRVLSELPERKIQ